MKIRESVLGILSRPLDAALRFRGVVKFFLHVSIFTVSFAGAFLLRFDFSVPPPYGATIRNAIPLVLISKASAFFVFGLFQGWWRYVSLRDILPIAGGCTLGSILFFGIGHFVLAAGAVPRSVYAIDWGLTLIMVLGARYFIRFGRETFGRVHRDTDRRVLIVGAGAARCSSSTWASR